MKNFKKQLNCKAVLLLLIAIFFLDTVAYGIDSLEKTYLRPPILFSNKYGTNNRSEKNGARNHSKFWTGARARTEAILRKVIIAAVVLQYPATSVAIEDSSYVVTTVEQLAFITEVPRERIIQILSNAHLPTSEPYLKLTHTLISLGYLKSGSQADEQGLVDILQEFDTLLKSKDKRISFFNKNLKVVNIKQLKEVIENLMSFLEGYVNIDEPQRLNILLVETFYPHILDSIDRLEISYEEKKELKQSIIGCVNAAYASYILMSLLDNVEVVCASGEFALGTGHGFNIISIKGEKTCLFIDLFGGGITELKDIDALYKPVQTEETTKPQDVKSSLKEGRYVELKRKLKRRDLNNALGIWLSGKNVSQIRELPLIQRLNFFYPFFRTNATNKLRFTALILNDIASVLDRMHMYEEALEICKKAKGLNPESAEVLVNSAVIAIHLAGKNDTPIDPEPLVSDLEKAIKVCPNSGKAYLNLGLVLTLLRRYGEAVEHWCNWASTIKIEEELKKKLPSLLKLLPDENLRVSAAARIREAYNKEGLQKEISTNTNAKAPHILHGTVAVFSSL